MQPGGGPDSDYYSKNNVEIHTDASGKQITTPIPDYGVDYVTPITPVTSDPVEPVTAPIEPVTAPIVPAEPTTTNETISDTAESDSESSSHHSSSSSSGGSGGAGGSPEPANNVAVKEIAQTFISSGKDVTFNFAKNATCVEYITFTATKTAGKTTTIVEDLKNKSTLVSKLPEGEVYKSFNVWVGNGGYGDSKNIENASIGFKVNNTWIQENNINQSSIVLKRYDDDTKEWKQLTTTIFGNDSKYVHLVADVPGFSSFAITGDKAVAKPTVPASKSPTGTVKNSTSIETKLTGESPKSPGFDTFFTVVCLFCIIICKQMQGR